MNRYDSTGNTAEDPFRTICVPNEIEGVNLKVLNIIKGTNESRALPKLILCECRRASDSRKCNS